MAQRKGEKAFNFSLSDDCRDRLERYRAAMGLRSRSDTMRKLIELGDLIVDHVTTAKK